MNSCTWRSVKLRLISLQHCCSICDSFSTSMILEAKSQGHVEEQHRAVFAECIARIPNSSVSNGATRTNTINKGQVKEGTSSDTEVLNNFDFRSDIWINWQLQGRTQFLMRIIKLKSELALYPVHEQSYLVQVIFLSFSLYFVEWDSFQIQFLSPSTTYKLIDLDKFGI